MKKIYRLGIVILIIIAGSIFSLTTVYAVTNKIKTKSTLPSYKYLPEYYDNFIYIKDFNNAEKLWKSSDIYKMAKDNYVFLDFKYKYFDTLDNQLIKFNFNTEKLLSMLKGELTAGNIGGNYFIITELSFTSRQLLSVLNMLPDAPILRETYRDVEYFAVQKSNKEIYYVKLGEHTLFGTNINFIKSSIDKKLSGVFTYSKELAGLTNENEVFIHAALPDDFNRFELLPKSLNGFDIVCNLENFQTTIIADKVKPEITRKGKMAYKESLKNIPSDIPFCMYNSSKDIRNLVLELLEYRKSLSGVDDEVKYQSKVNSASEILDQYNNGLLLLVDSFMTKENSPNLGMMLIPDKELTSIEYKQNGNELKNVAELLLGLDANKWATKENNSYIKYSNGDFTVISSARIAGLLSDTNETLSGSITSLIGSQGTSLYDYVYKGGETDNTNNELSMVYINNRSMTSMIEPVFIKYINTLNVTDKDYEKSFGGLFNYLKKLDPYLIVLENKKNEYGDVFYGSGDFIKK